MAVLTKKKKKELHEAVYSSTQEILRKHAPRTLEDPPDMWEREEIKIFDMMTEVEILMVDKINAL